jgi:diacylglycerol kinase (ATP)
MIPGGSTIPIIVNPVAGRVAASAQSPGGRAVAVLVRRIQEAGLKPQVTETGRRGEAEAIASRSCREGVGALVVAGGDGTVNEVVSGMTGEGVPILVAPTGTENILAKYLGIALDGDFLWRVLERGRVVGVDVAELAGCAGGAADGPAQPAHRSFLLVGGVGFDAKVTHEVARRRQTLMESNGGHISYLTYLMPAWRALWGYRPPRLSVEVDGRPFYSGPAQVLIGNVPRYAMGARPMYRAKPDDGLLDVCVFECRRRLSVLRHFVNMMLRRHMNAAGFFYSQGRNVRVCAEEKGVPVQVDGDVAGWLPAEFFVSGRRAKLLVPESFQL